MVNWKNCKCCTLRCKDADLHLTALKDDAADLSVIPFPSWRVYRPCCLGSRGVLEEAATAGEAIMRVMNGEHAVGGGG